MEENSNLTVDYSQVAPDREEDPMSLSVVASKVRRSVVSIAIYGENSSSAASGVIVDINVNGEQNPNVFYVITCHHVIDSLGDITVYVPDMNCRNPLDADYDSKFAFNGKIGSEIYTNQSVTLVGGDKKSDIAVLKLDITGTNVSPNDIVKAKFMDVSKHTLSYGEEVFAIGNPGGDAPGSLSHGVVTYLYRQTEIEDIGAMILNQIDVQTNPGSSGGPLFNMYGEIVGITNAGDTSIDGVNFAIPLTVPAFYGAIDNGVLNVAKQLIASKTETNYGYVSGRRATWGVTFLASTTDNVTTITIDSIEENSLAQSAGLRKGDKVLKLKINDGEWQTVTKMADISSAVNQLNIGDVITFKVQRSLFNVGEIDIPLTAYQYLFCNTAN